MVGRRPGEEAWRRQQMVVKACIAVTVGKMVAMVAMGKMLMLMRTALRSGNAGRSHRPSAARGPVLPQDTIVSLQLQ